VITGWLAGEDCPDCGGPLLETSTDAHHIILECPGCAYRTLWLVPGDPGTPANPDDPSDPDGKESE
jgi:hypothetical protein